MKKVGFLLALLVVCNLSNQKLADKMIEKYSDDQNYVSLIGEVVECNANSVEIRCDELKNYIYYEDEICEYYIYSTQIFDLSVGERIEFTTVPFHFYNGQKLPIVELKTNEMTLLAFIEGKECLIDWVETFG